MVGIEIEVPLVRVWHPLWTIVEFTNSSYQSKKLKINWLSNYIYYNLMKLSNYISLVCLTCLEYRLTLFGKKTGGIFKVPVQNTLVNEVQNIQVSKEKDEMGQTCEVDRGTTLIIAR